MLNKLILFIISIGDYFHKKKIIKFFKKSSIDKFDCSLPRDISLVYAISLCVSSNLKKIYFAGFDGFGGQNFERNEINSFLKNLKNKYKSLKLISLTKTKFKF